MVKRLSKAASVAFIATGALADPPKEGGNVTNRTVRLFDFDGARNPDPVPPGWERTTLTPDGHPRAGFAKFNRAEIDSAVAYSGTRSVRLPTKGQSTALRLRAGEAAVFSDADYAVSARVRTDGLEHARAFVTVRLLDQGLTPIPGTEVRSVAVAAPGMWKQVSVQVPGGRIGAAWLQIDLELLQPRQFAESASDDPASKALEKHRVYREDVSGSAWFDDVAIMQIPRAGITTTSPCNIVLAGEKPTLQVSVRDLGGDALRARVRVIDIRGRQIDEYVSEISPDGRARMFSPRLPGYGWYRARLEVLSAVGGETAVSHAEVEFVHLAGGGAGDAGASPMATRAAAQTESDRARFGLIAERMPDDRWGDLPVLVPRLGTRFVYLSAWGAESTLESAAESLAARRPAIEAMLRQGQEVTFSIRGVPAELSRATLAPGDDALALAAMQPTQWMPYLSPTLDIFGQRVLRYQIGGAGDDHAFWKKDLARDIGAVESGLGTLVPGPMICLPWPGDRVLPLLGPQSGSLSTRSGAEGTGRLVDALTVSYPLGFPAEAIGGVLRSMREAIGTEVEITVVLELPRSSLFGGFAGITELMRRTVELWKTLGDGPVGASGKAGATEQAMLRLALNQPWVWSGDADGGEGEEVGGGSQVWPRPELAALSVVMERLCGRRVVGELTSVAGVKCYIIAARNSALGTLERGAMVAWNESADPAHAIVDAAAVGAAVTVVDAFGNQVSIPVPGSESDSASGSNAASPLVTVPVGETPVFVEGIDPYLALFAASFKLEPSFMPAVVREHEHRITLSNPWPMRITGKLQLKEDAEASPRGSRGVTDEWRVSPTGIIDFDMAPGQTQSLPVTISFGPGQLAGAKDFVIVARATADRPYPPIRMHATVEVGLEDIEMNPELQIGSGSDVVVVATVTNKGTRTRTLRLETAARNMPSQQVQVSDLPAGQTVLRRFVFRGAAAALSGRRVVVSLTDLEEAQRLNKAVLVP